MVRETPCIYLLLAVASLPCCTARRSGTAATASHPDAGLRSSASPVGDDLARRKLDEGRRCLFTGDFPGARAAFAIASRNPLTRPSALIGLAEAEFQLGDFTAAESSAARGVAAGGGVRAHVVLGNIRFKLRNYRGAITSYEAALALDAGNAEARRNLASARRRIAQRRGEP